MCAHRLFDGPLVCTRTDAHTTHTYMAAWGRPSLPDRHDEDGGEE